MSESTNPEPLRSDNFENYLTDLLNQECMENDSGTPDFIIAAYLLRCLENFGVAVRARESWYGRESVGRVETEGASDEPREGPHRRIENRA